ncbi:MAG: PAS domain-containing sensor histidine kinase [Candidatus Handelsmanbacteria bacterium RIFCSPLOWO2_12_FULL_64_10]|uniref:histidine kinase n=1 Tax=Handelsmanbacteria sp. (strain RIFCSPLOWO2_12_FULL_64_10) TaxID=1817868 RepID=A0A1F6D2Y4_HANXR|nr:MAG: PAS domain-containing sensor histidine kinase [Candidatus Handelsmanbacteria bacterium RIFCSPLOWO2_12_FULL_64_10]
MEPSLQESASGATAAIGGLFEGILESTPNAIVVADSQGVICVANPQADRLFGYARGELLGSAVEVLVPDSARGRHLEHRERYAQDPHTRPMGVGLNLKARRKDGSEFWAEISLSPLRTQAGLFVISSIHDVTERREWEQALAQRTAELEQSNDELQQFAYIASHDLQEPLRMVVSFMQLLQRRYQGKLDPQAEEYIQFAVEGGTRMQLLIQDLLRYSRAGSREFTREFVDFNEVVDRVVAELGPTIEEAGATVTRDDLPMVVADPLEMGRVFQNLLANAIKYRGDAPPIVHVTAEQVAGACVFSVRDNGIGIPLDQSDRIFRLFQRLHGHDEYPGTGIGLSICKRIVERHGGRIWVHSTPGQGSTFLFTLPLEED